MMRVKEMNPASGYVPSKRVALKELSLPESWLEEKIREDHTILGLGGITKTVFQRRYKKAGRVDLVLMDEENSILYCAELMLGEVDESHIVRCVEYWLSESRKAANKGWSVIAVLAAERVRESRYFPVIEFLSQKLPLTVLEVTALNVSGNTTLTFTKFFDGQDQVEQSESEDADQGRLAVDKEFWVNKRPAPIIRIADSLAKLFQSADNRLSITYLQGFWGLKLGEKPKNFVSISPKQKFVNVRACIRDTETWGDKLSNVGLEITGGAPGRSLRVRVKDPLTAKQSKVLSQLGEEAYNERMERT
jgi:hypothetical protein